MRTKCYSVRLASLDPISDKAYRAVAFDGSTAIIPQSQIFGQDHDVNRSEAWWISAWILGQKKLQYSHKKEAWFDENRKMLPTYNVYHHNPEKFAAVTSNEINDLKK